MSNKINGKFYPLNNQEWQRAWQELKPAEIRILYHLRTLDPWGKRELELGVSSLARDLGIAKGTVSKALRSLAEKGWIDLELIKVKVKLKSLSEENTVSSGKHCCEEETPVSQEKPQFPRGNPSFSGETPVSQRKRSQAQTQTKQNFQNSQTIQTYKDFIKTLSEDERERFLKFSRNKADRLPETPQLIEKWIVDNHHWIYLELEKVYGQEPKHSGEGQGSAPQNSDEKNDLHPEIETGLADGRIQKLDPYSNGLGVIDAKGCWWTADEWIEIAEGKGGVCPINPNAQKYQLQCKKWFVQIGGNNPDDKTASGTPILKLEEVL